MGRLYVKEMIGDKTIGYFQNGEVTKGNPSGLLADISVVIRYENGNIYTYSTHTVAYCDEYGNIHDGGRGGSVLAKCENGIVYNGSGYGKTEIARYEGDMYGAAAAVAALILHLGSESTAGTSNSESIQTDSSNSDSSTNSSSTGGSSESSGCFSAIIHFLLGAIVFIPMCIWCILPLLMICILTLVAVLDEINIFDEDFITQIVGFSIIIALIIGSVNAIRIIKNSRQFKLTRKQVILSRLINNSGVIVFYLFSAVINASTSYAPISSGRPLGDADTPAFGPFLEIIALAAMCLSPILTIIYLRKCKTKKP